MSKRVLLMAFAFSIYCTGCGSASTPSKPNSSETQDSLPETDYEVRDGSYESYEKSMALHLQSALIDNFAKPSLDEYSLRFANATDDAYVRNIYKCSFFQTEKKSSESDLTVESILFETEAKLAEIGIENLALDSIDPLANKKIIIHIGYTSQQCADEPRSFAEFDREQFFVDESIHILVTLPENHSISDETLISSTSQRIVQHLRLSVNRGTLSVENNLTDSSEYIDEFNEQGTRDTLFAFSNVISNLDDDMKVSVAPVWNDLETLIPGNLDLELTQGLDRIFSVTLGLSNDKKSGRNINNSGKFGSLFNWMSGLLGSVQNGGTGNALLDVGLQLLSSSPQLILASALLEVFLSDSLPATRPADTINIPDFANLLELNSTLPLGTIINRLYDHRDYVETYYEGKQKESLMSMLAVAYSQAFHDRMETLNLQSAQQN